MLTPKKPKTCRLCGTKRPHWIVSETHCLDCLGKKVAMGVMVKFTDASGHRHYLTFTMDVIAGIEEDAQVEKAYRKALSALGFLKYTINRVEFDIKDELD